MGSPEGACSSPTSTFSSPSSWSSTLETSPSPAAPKRLPWDSDGTRIEKFVPGVGQFWYRPQDRSAPEMHGGFFFCSLSLSCTFSSSSLRSYFLSLSLFLSVSSSLSISPFHSFSFPLSLSFTPLPPLSFLHLIFFLSLFRYSFLFFSLSLFLPEKGLVQLLALSPSPDSLRRRLL